MDGVDMSGMAGMGMDGMSQGMFEPANSRIAKIYWCIIGVALAVGLVANLLRKAIVQQRFDRSRCDMLTADADRSVRNRKWQQRAHPSSSPATPRNALSQTYATVTAIRREMSYPQGHYLKSRWFAWLTPPPVGRSLILIVYIVALTIMTFSNSVVHDAYYFERVGFRAAWMSVMQVPFIVLLSGKTSLIGLVIGSSHERMNWLHRWTARVLLVTVAIHAAFFLAEWVRAEFVSLEMQMMPMVKYGMGAGGTLLFMNLTGLAPVRRLAYEMFVLLHLASIALFLWLLYNHVPSYAMQYVWLAIGFVAFDRIVRTLGLFYRNVVGSMRQPRRLRFGYTAEMKALPDGIVHVTIKDVPFRWHPAAYVYIWLPRIGFFESHPFTISNIPSGSSDLELTIRSHSGFTRRLHAFASKRATINRPASTCAFVQGPFGAHISWNTFDTVILISASTGASFTLPILDSIINDPCCVRRVEFLLLVKNRSHCTCYLYRLRAAAQRAASLTGVQVGIRVAVTQDVNDESDIGDTAGTASPWLVAERCCASHLEGQTCDCVIHVKPDTAEQQARKSVDDSAYSSAEEVTEKANFGDVVFSHARPDLDDVIRPPVEAARGETGIAVCGGKPLTSHVRNYVARLSDERAVHKGTGAQGIFLHTEEYCL